jgi:hypothetical protein
VVIKNTILSLSFLLFSALPICAQQSAALNSSEGAVHGFDPVAYFKEGKPVKGDARDNLSWNSATRYFSNQQSLEAFKASPEKFAPQ